MPHQPERRSFLKWVIHGLSAVFAVVLGAPLVAYLIDPRHRTPPERGLRPIAKLDELIIGQPREYVIREDQRDAWALRPDEIVGRIFLIRRGPREVQAYTTICPHLGCSINWLGPGQGYLCPCHGARFGEQCQRVAPDHNPSERDMDSLECSIRDGDDMVLVRYQEFVPGPEKTPRT